MSISNYVGKLIKKYRKDRGLTIEELAGRVNISKTYLSLIENQARNINIKRIDEIAAALGVPTRSLLQESEDADLEQENSEDFIEVIPRGASPENRVRIQMVELGEVYVGSKGRKKLLHRRIPLISQDSDEDPGVFYSGEMPDGLVLRELSAPPDIDDLTAFAMEMPDSSMRPRMEKGDILIACPAWKIKSGGFVIVKTLSERATCRLYHENEGGVMLTALNSDFPPRFAEESEISWIYPLARLVADLY